MGAMTLEAWQFSGPLRPQRTDLTAEMRAKLQEVLKCVRRNGSTPLSLRCVSSCVWGLPQHIPPHGQVPSSVFLLARV